MRWSGLLIVLFAFLAGRPGRPDGIEPVSPFDLNRHEGVWYEIMRLDHRVRTRPPARSDRDWLAARRALFCHK